MEVEISAFSLHRAFRYFEEEVKEQFPENQWPDSFDDFLNLDGLLKKDSSVTGEAEKLFGNSGHVIGYTIKSSDVNVNQIQTQVVNTENPKGDKKWETVYLAVFDKPTGDKVVPGTSGCKTKKECIDIAREVSGIEKRDVFVLIGKTANNFPRCQAQIIYKPSPKQKQGLYKFVW